LFDAKFKSLNLSVTSFSKASYLGSSALILVAKALNLSAQPHADYINLVKLPFNSSN